MEQNCCLVTKSCPTLCDPMDYSLSGSSVHGISQVRILEWVAISFLQGIFPTQGSNLGLRHWQADSDSRSKSMHICQLILNKSAKNPQWGERVCLKMLRKLDVNMQRNEIGTLSYKKST